VAAHKIRILRSFIDDFLFRVTALGTIIFATTTTLTVDIEVKKIIYFTTLATARNITVIKSTTATRRKGVIVTVTTVRHTWPCHVFTARTVGHEILRFFMFAFFRMLSL